MLKKMDIDGNPIDLMCFEQPLVLVDLETTGFSTERDRIIEIAALRLEEGCQPVAFSTLIEHGKLSTGSSYIHGIYRNMLKGAPLFSDTISILQDLCQDALLVAHNASFEDRFLKAEMARAGGRWAQPRLCTMMFARRALSHRKGRGAHSLNGIAEEFDVPVKGHHEAFSDVLMLHGILGRMIDAFKKHSEFTKWLKASTKSSEEQSIWPKGSSRNVRLKSRY